MWTVLLIAPGYFTARPQLVFARDRGTHRLIVHSFQGLHVVGGAMDTLKEKLRLQGRRGRLSTVIVHLGVIANQERAKNYHCTGTIVDSITRSLFSLEPQIIVNLRPTFDPDIENVEKIADLIRTELPPLARDLLTSDQLFSYEEVADISGKTRRRIQQLVKAGTLQVVIDQDGAKRIPGRVIGGYFSGERHLGDLRAVAELESTQGETERNGAKLEKSGEVERRKSGLAAESG